MLKKKALVLSAMITAASPAMAGWRWKNLDPFNRNSGIRRTAANLDPFAGLGRLKTRLITRMAYAVAHDPEFRSKAKSEGWTMNKCRIAGAGIAGPIIVFQGGAICTALTAGEPLSDVSCIATLTASATTITELACTQLCNDRKLRDCY